MTYDLPKIDKHLTKLTDFWHTIIKTFHSKVFKFDPCFTMSDRFIPWQ